MAQHLAQHLDQQPTPEIHEKDRLALEQMNQPLILGNPSYADVTRVVSQIVEVRTAKIWWMALSITGGITGLLGSMLAYLVWTGIGVWGNNAPVGWGWDITNFVFWIGIGHAGTLISAILFLFRQKWRTSINRFAEAMTLFAVACAGIYPAFHGPSARTDPEERDRCRSR